MNYLINIWKIPIFVLYFILYAALFFALLSKIIGYLNRFAGRSKIVPLFIFLFLLGGMALCIFSYYAINAQFNDGRINQLYINDDPPRLAVWFTRTDSIELANYYAHRLKTFDLEKGTLLGRLDLAKWEGINDFELFGPFDGKAWGYSKKTGVRLLDLFQAKVLFSQEEILKRHPELAKPLKAYAFDPQTNMLYMVAANGKFYGIYPDLKVLPLRVDVAVLYPKAAEKNSNPLDLKILLKKDQEVLATLTRDDEALVFISTAGYTLSATRIDPKTGKILGKINYF